jgi:hypothetical protein
MANPFKYFRISDAFPNGFPSAVVNDLNDHGITCTIIDQTDPDSSISKTYRVIEAAGLERFICDHWEWSYWGETSAEAYAAFLARWDLWKQSHNTDIQRACKAWYTEYNPLENYNRTETGHKDIVTGDDTTYGTTTLTHNEQGHTVRRLYGDDTADGSKLPTTISINDNSIDTVAGTKPTTTNSATTYDDTTERETGKSEIEGTTASRGLSVETYTPTAGGATDTTSEHTDNRDIDTDEDTTFHAYGNIGVTTSQQMLEQEEALRLFRPVAVRLLEWFASECLVLLPNHEDWGAFYDC